MNFKQSEPILMTGGLSMLNALIKTISKTLGLNVVSDPQALYAGAIGACLCAAK